MKISYLLRNSPLLSSRYNIGISSLLLHFLVIASTHPCFLITPPCSMWIGLLPAPILSCTCILLTILMTPRHVDAGATIFLLRNHQTKIRRWSVVDLKSRRRDSYRIKASGFLSSCSSFPTMHMLRISRIYGKCKICTVHIIIHIFRIRSYQFLIWFVNFCPLSPSI